MCASLQPPAQVDVCVHKRGVAPSPSLSEGSLSGCFGAARRCGTARRSTTHWPARPRRRVVATGSSAALLPLPDSSVDSLSAPDATARASEASVASLPSASTCSPLRAPRRLPGRTASHLRALPTCLTRPAAQSQPMDTGQSHPWHTEFVTAAHLCAPSGSQPVSRAESCTAHASALVRTGSMRSQGCSQSSSSL
jgi:hypothetical protein